MSSAPWVNQSGMTISTTTTTNDTATSTGAGWATGGGVGQTAGQWYFECAIFALSPPTGNTSGIGISSTDLSQNFLGNANTAIHGSQGGSGSGSWAGVTNGFVYGVAYDLTASLFWIGLVGNCNGSHSFSSWSAEAEPISWNGSTSNAPGTGGGGSGGLAMATFTDIVYPLIYVEEVFGTIAILQTTGTTFISPLGTPS